MSGTDHSQIIEPKLQPRILLVRPQMGENIGAAARAMWNFGLERMSLVAPRDGWPNPAATAMASGAARVLDQIVVADDLPTAIADLQMVYATTARPRGLTKAVLSPKQAMKEMRDFAAKGVKTGVLFGPERSGLETDDVVLADKIISVPVNPAYGSLNLAQCVLLLAYEWQLSALDCDPSAMEWGNAEPADHRDRAFLVNSLTEKLDAMGFFWPEDKAEPMRQNLENMFARFSLSNADIRIFHGIFRALSRGESFSNKKMDRKK